MIFCVKPTLHTLSDKACTFTSIRIDRSNFKLASLHHNFSKKNVLEIGCGIGRLLKPLSLKFRQVYGIDVSPVMIKKAKVYLNNQSNVHLHQTSGTDLSIFPNAFFDFVFAFAIFEHTPATVVYQYFKEAFRVLKKKWCV